MGGGGEKGEGVGMKVPSKGASKLLCTENYWPAKGGMIFVGGQVL